MIPRVQIGKGITGVTRYVLGEGQGAGNDNLAPGQESRVLWIGGTGLGFAVKDRADADLARRMMEFMAFNQGSPTRKCEMDAVHLSLAWRPGEAPTREQMEDAARAALAAMGMGNAMALFVAHNDEGYAHVHIVASKINPDTGRAYDLKGNYLKLSRWAEQYERDYSGGVICLRREEANRLRDAITARDAGAVLEHMTEKRATFTEHELLRVLAKQIRGPLRRAQFAEKVLGHKEAVRLSDEPGGPVTRYTSRAVLDAEQQVLAAAASLQGVTRHRLTERRVLTVLGRFEAQGQALSAEQVAALRHASGGSGLALIDGQAGTGKSHTIRAIREAYEGSGCRVIGLAPTNAVAADMRTDGFRHANTLHSELFALNNARTSWTRNSIVIVDEAAMVDTKIMAMLGAHAHQSGAKLILVGDDRQLSSIERGGMFGALKDRYGAAALTEVRRQYKDDERRAASMMAEGNFHDALSIYEGHGAIHWTRTQMQARAELVRVWERDTASAPEKSRFVFAYTNVDVSQLNADLRAVRRKRGELGEDHQFETAFGKLAFAERDRIQLTATDKRLGLLNGTVGTITAIEGDNITVRFDGRAGHVATFDGAAFQDFRHGYAGTIYKGQGRTLDQTYLYHSEHWRSAASYVALTRHRDKAEMFVATNTAPTLGRLARQMARVDDRRAASQFYQASVKAPVSPMAPQALAAHLASSGEDRRLRPEEKAQQAAGAATAPDRNIMTTPPHPGGGSAMNQQMSPEEAARLAAIAAERQRHDDALRLDALSRENADRLVEQTKEMQQQQELLAGFAERQKRVAEEARQEEERKRQTEERAKAAEGEIRDAGNRYRVALGENYDMRDPYGSLARAAMSEYAAFIRDREKLDGQIAKTDDPHERKALELRKEIEGADYMAITSRRIAGQSEAIAGHRNTEEAVKFRERASEYEDRSKDLREQFRQHHEKREAWAEGQYEPAADNDTQTLDDDKGTRHEAEATRRDERKSDYDAASRESTTPAKKPSREEEAFANVEMTDAKRERLSKLGERHEQTENAIKDHSHQPQRSRGFDRS